jgi:hypothetical protein
MRFEGPGAGVALGGEKRSEAVVEEYRLITLYTIEICGTERLEDNRSLKKS